MSVFSLIVNKIGDIGLSLYERGFIAGTDGNISVKLDDKRIVITKSGICKGRLTPNDFAIINLDNQTILNGPPSSEYGMHLYIYQQRTDIRACVHTHPPYTTAFSVANIALEKSILPEVILSVGPIGLTEFALPGSEAMATSLEPFIKKRNAFILKNHGLVTIGSTIEEAFYRTETVEHCAKIRYFARQLGNVDYLSDKDVTRLEQIQRDKGPKTV